MASTNIKSDASRIKTDLELLTQTCNYQFTAPGPGSDVGFQENPYIRMQKHGANLRTNTINLESDLMGLSRSLNKDNINSNNYKTYAPKTERVTYESSNCMGTDQSRVSHPGWMYKDSEQVNWYILPTNPQEHTERPFHNNLSTRILEKDYWSPSYESTTNTSTSEIKFKNFLDGGKSCVDTNTCDVPFKR